jgi:hypothetical protein
MKLEERRERTTMTEPRIAEELEKMESEYEPLLPVERKLIWYTFSTGVVLLAIFVLISRWFV